MRQAVAFLLLCSLSVHCAGRLGIVARWWLDRDYIARELCVNRAAPQLQCGGKCYLVKQLRATDTAEQKQLPNSNRQAFQEIILFCAVMEPLCFAAPVVIAAAPRYVALRVWSHTRALPVIDHPPARC